MKCIALQCSCLSRAVWTCFRSLVPQYPLNRQKKHVLHHIVTEGLVQLLCRSIIGLYTAGLATDFPGAPACAFAVSMKLWGHSSCAFPIALSIVMLANKLQTERTCAYLLLGRLRQAIMGCSLARRGSDDMRHSIILSVCPHFLGISCLV